MVIKKTNFVFLIKKQKRNKKQNAFFDFNPILNERFVNGFF